jgi:enterochelin esterase-like enzyme
MDQVSRCGMDKLWFRLDDPDLTFGGVRLQQRSGLRDTEFQYDDHERAWTLVVPRSPAWRVEYQFEVRYPDGRTQTLNDPGNPRRAPGAFGDRSVLECPDYAAPAWLDAPASAGAWRELAVPVPTLGADGEAGTVPVRIWSPDTAADLVLVAHDGPEFDRLGSLQQFCASMIAAGRVPPHNLVLLPPGDRNEWYSANPAYAEGLTGALLPAVARAVGSDRPVVGLGVSLGALAMLHGQRHDPGAFAGLFLQSGSFFLPRLDPQERGFAQYRRIVRFVAQVMRTPGVPVATTLTCGTVEENLANNRCLTRTLRAQRYPVSLVEVPDGHNFTAWRDALDPHLVTLLAQAWRDA